MMPAELIAHEALARLANPVLMATAGGAPSGRGVVRGHGRPAGGQVRGRHPAPVADPPTREEAPALLGRLTAGGLRVGDLLRSPQGRERSLEAVALALLRDGTR